MGNSLTYPMTTAVDTSLIFLYDPFKESVLFTNQSPDSFFGTSIDLESPFPFHDLVNEKEIAITAIEWQKCLLLTNEQQYGFSLPSVQNNSLANGFYIHAAAVIIERDAISFPLILFTITKQALPVNEEPYKKELEEFIDVAAHDLDAPLRRLAVFVERLTAKYSQDNNEEVKEYVQRINACLAGMRSLIDDLSALSKVSTGDMNIVSCDFNIIVRNVIKDLDHLIKEKKALIRYHGLPVIEGDIEQCHQLIKGLLHNALTFIDKGKDPMINISSEMVSPEEKKHYGLITNSNYFKIEIVDNGIGFNQEMAGKIFRPFMRLHAKSAYPGNGIGLAITIRITKNHGGIIYVYSTENAGSRFTFILPQTSVKYAQLP